MEASALAFGVAMSMLEYTKTNERGLWRDMLSEPDLIALEGMLGEGERGRTLVRVGLKGSAWQLFAIVIYTAYVTWLDWELLLAYSYCFPFVLLGMGSAIIFKTRIAFRHVLHVFTFYLLLALAIEGTAAYYLLLAEVSFRNTTLGVLDAFTIVPLDVAAVSVYLPWLATIYHKMQTIVVAIRSSSPRAPLRFRENVEAPCDCCFLRPVSRFLERINVYEPEENGQRRAPQDSNSSPTSAV